MKTKLFNTIMTAAILSANASAPADSDAEGRFRLDKIGARHVLLDPEGEPFFTLGINHINAVQETAEPDIFAEAYGGDWSRYSEAAAEDLQGWHYNTAGYGSPQEIYPRMPYMEDSFLERNSN
ncbi:MAG: hypothetical protein ACPF9Q_03805, partial [Opitutales bacterium]